MQKKTVFIVALVLFFVSAMASYIVFGKMSGSIPSSFGFLSNSGNLVNSKNGPSTTPGVVVDTEPKTEECPINGQLFSKTQAAKWATRRPLGVMIENHKEARPQSGISAADVVYEIVAEGGITRTLDIFYCQDAPYVGPVRSARIYFIRYLQEYGNYPLYAHVGGAAKEGPADALGEIKTLGWAVYNDLNSFSVPFPVYANDLSRLLPERAWEHTTYSATKKLWDYAAKNRKLTNVDSDGVAWDEHYVKYKFKDDAAVADRGTVNTIPVGFWNQFASDYSVVWHYMKDKNSYDRENGGEAHVDHNTNQVISPKNVVVIFSKETVANDGYELGQHLLYKTIGTGDALVFQDGKAIKAKWSKADDDKRTIITDATTGKEVSFVRGQIFFQVIPLGNKVEYTQ